MQAETFELWASAIEALADPDSAELAVLELFEHQSKRPGFADVRAAYQAVRRRTETEQPVLATGDPSGAWSIEGAKRLAGGHRIGGKPFDPMVIPDKAVEEAERKAKQAWMERGLTRAERIASVKADIARLVEESRQQV